MKHGQFVGAAGLAVAIASSIGAQAQVKAEPWGKTSDGKAVNLYTLKDADLTVRITDFGAHIVEIDAPDKTGKPGDVVLGFQSVQGYETKSGSSFQGAIVGRYGNRIAQGRFTLEGQPHQLSLNEKGITTLHGGKDGFDQRLWTAKTLPNGLELTLVSPDGDQGFPGQLTAHVTYTLVGKSLRIQYAAATTKPTVVNLTNHSYFNLGGEASGDVLKEIVEIPADNITPVDAHLIPTGQLGPVAGTPFDFRKPTPIGARIDTTSGPGADQLKIAGGYDHNWVLNGAMQKPGTLHEAAKVVDPASGRTLTVTTTEPGVQFYTGNFLDGSLTGRSGGKYGKHAGLCLETQHFPDSPNHPNFPTTELKPGQTLHSETVFTFGVQR